MKKSLLAGVAVLALGLAAAGCSSSSTPSTTTVAKSPTSTATTGGPTPTEVGQAYVTATLAGKGAGDPFCATYALPGEAAKCRSVFSQLGEVTVTAFALGAVPTEGSRAIANFTGRVCKGSECVSESDLNSATAGGRSFDKAYAIALNPDNPDSTPFFGALVEHDGRWYATGF